MIAADTTAAPAGELEEITVTAEKRAESQQNVPMSMTTFGTVQLQEKAIVNFFDYATKVPNLAFAPTGDGVGTARTISIRGVSGNNVTSYYIDDTPLPDSIDPRILDIDHIEVLRGPQGTLYGARSMGGLVRTVTKEPDLNDFSATLHGGYSDTARTSTGNYTGDGVFNIPLIQDKLALRLSGFGDYQAGYFKRSYCTNPAAAMNLTCLPLAGPGTHHSRQRRRDRHLGLRREPHLQAHRLAHHHPALHAAANRLQRLSDVGLPHRYRQRHRLSGADAATGAPTPNRMIPNDFTQARWFNVPEGGWDDWGLSSLTVHWKTNLGELVSSSSYFSRKVVETEDESDFVYAGITSGAGGSPQPGGISEEKDYQEFRPGSALRLRPAGADPIRHRRLLLGHPRARAVLRLLSAGDGAGARSDADRHTRG